MSLHDKLKAALAEEILSAFGTWVRGSEDVIADHFMERLWPIVEESRKSEVLDDVDMAETERCPQCLYRIWQDEEGDWNHVFTNEDGAPVALMIGCQQ
jgi:hypothetical protein